MFHNTHERSEGNLLRGLILSGTFGFIGLGVAILLGREKTLQGAFIGFVAWIFGVLVFVVGPMISWGPQLVESEACMCSFTLDAGMRHGALDGQYEGAQFTAASEVRGLYLTDHVIPKQPGLAGPFESNARWLLERAELGTVLRVVDPWTRTEIGGLPAYTTANIGRWESGDWYQLVAIVDGPTSFHFIYAWTQQNRVTRNEKILRSVVASFRDHES